MEGTAVLFPQAEEGKPNRRKPNRATRLYFRLLPTSYPRRRADSA